MSKKSVALALVVLTLSLPASAARTRNDQPVRAREPQPVLQRAVAALGQVVRAFENWPTLPRP
jgi:hypothetical protein